LARRIAAGLADGTWSVDTAVGKLVRLASHGLEKNILIEARRSLNGTYREAGKRGVHPALVVLPVDVYDGRDPLTSLADGQKRSCSQAAPTQDEWDLLAGVVALLGLSETYVEAWLLDCRNDQARAERSHWERTLRDSRRAGCGAADLAANEAELEAAISRVRTQQQMADKLGISRAAFAQRTKTVRDRLTTEIGLDKPELQALKSDGQAQTAGGVPLHGTARTQHVAKVLDLPTEEAARLVAAARHKAMTWLDNNYDALCRIAERKRATRTDTLDAHDA
jgi:hypothetical protein